MKEISVQTQEENRRLLAGLVQVLLVLFRADAPAGGVPEMFTEVIIEAVGLNWDPKDVAGAVKVILRDRRDRTFPLPAEIRDAIIRAKKIRYEVEAMALFDLQVEYHDEQTQRVFYIQTHSIVERDSLKARLADAGPGERQLIATEALWKAGQKTPRDYAEGYRHPVKPSWTPEESSAT